jgi:hypothetical protein
MHRLWSLLRRWLSILYFIAIALMVIGALLFLVPGLKGTIWQTIGGVLVGTGFTMLVTTITSQQSIHEQYKKEANLQRKADVYGPLHAELKELREIFDEAHAGRKPYPLWIEITGEDFRPSFYMSAYTPPTFFYWPSFKNNYRVDDFTDSARKLLDDVQSCIRAYNEAAQIARKVIKEKLRGHLEIRIVKVEQSSEYKEWLQKRNQPPYISNRWFEFIQNQLSFASFGPIADGESNSWTAQTFGWLLADRADQAAIKINEGDIGNMSASERVPISWFQDLFEATLIDLKNDPAYQGVMDAQEKLFKRLQHAEKRLKDVMNYIRDRYQGGLPPI